MKKFKVFVALLLAVTVSFTFAKKGTEGNGSTLVSSTIDQTVITFELNTYDLDKVNSPYGKLDVLDAADTGRMLIKGAPELLKMSASVIVPDQARMTVEVIDSVYVDVNNVTIAPSKGNLLRNVDPEAVPYEFGAVYNTNAFYPSNIAELAKAHIIRDYRGQAVTVYPTQYNPVTKVLRVYKSITVKVSNTGSQGENVLPATEASKKESPAFTSVYSNHFINYTPFEYTMLNDPIDNMLIVSYGDFMDEMADFVSWKQSIGYNVSMVDYATIGSSTALKTYVANYYNTNGLTYLLLVGDHAQVPTSSTSAGDSDQNYGLIVGSDHYVDIFVGRFSAETGAHVTTQVDRTLNYERDVLSSASFFRHAIGMGSSEGPGHDSEYDYVHINNILSDLEGYGYTGHECHQSGGSATLMSSLINAGSGVIFYCGHGTVSSWYTTSWQYTSTHVDALVNEWELPFVISVACVVGDFTTNTCYSEVWQRATNNGNPTGSVAHCGSTINQSWIPPMDAEDEMADLLVAGSVRTFGGMFVNGMFKMIDLNGSGGEDMADTWLCFGDPSVQLRTPGTPDGPYAGPPVAPVADFSADNTTVYEGASVNFTDLSSNIPTTWAWTFNGGTPSTSTAKNPVVTYNNAGNYTVELTATNSAGSDTETKVGYITVEVNNCGGTEVNGGFETGDTSGWTTTGTASITSTSHTGAYGISLVGTNSTVEQVITGLCPNTTYTVTGWGLAKSQAGAYLGVKNYGGSDLTSQFADQRTWRQKTIVFTTGSTDTSATIFFTRTTSRFSAYGDDFAITQN